MFIVSWKEYCSESKTWVEAQSEPIEDGHDAWEMFHEARITGCKAIRVTDTSDTTKS